MAKRLVSSLVVLAFLSGAAASGEEPVDLRELWGPLLEEPVCGPHLKVVVDHFEPVLNDQPVPEDAGDLEAALYAILAQNVFDCKLLQFIAAAAVDDREFNAELRKLGLAIPPNPDRARAAFRRLALFGVRTDSMESLIKSAQFWGFAAPDVLEDGRRWVESLDAMTAEALLAEARQHQALDDDLAKYLERMAALKGSREAAVLVARRALADPDFNARFVLGHYLARAINAGAVDLEEELQRLHPDWRVREYLMERAQSGDVPYERHILWR